MTDYRASFDAVITFSNGGDLSVRGFRVDLPSAGTGHAEIGALFVASLGLLMTDEVALSNVEIFAEPHKGTRGGPAALVGSAGAGRLVDLSTFTTRVHLPVGPVALERTVGVPAIVVRLSGARTGEIGVGAVAAVEVGGLAVLLQARGRRLTREAAAWLAAQGAALVGWDETAHVPEPAADSIEVLLDAGVPIVVGLAGLDLVPPSGASFTAAPPLTPGPARAYALVPGD